MATLRKFVFATLVNSLDTDFEKVAYELAPSTTNKPTYAEVKTSHGYHIIVSCFRS